MWDLATSTKISALHEGLEKHFVNNLRQVAVTADGDTIAATIGIGLWRYGLKPKNIYDRACFILSITGGKNDFIQFCTK